ncbi:hypothetical protein D3C73_1287360 [compost metagenome]
MIGCALSVQRGEGIKKHQPLQPVGHLFGCFLDDCASEAVSKQNNMMEILLLNKINHRLCLLLVCNIFVRIRSMPGIFRRVDGMSHFPQLSRNAIPKACIHPGPVDQYKG